MIGRTKLPLMKMSHFDCTALYRIEDVTSLQLKSSSRDMVSSKLISHSELCVDEGIST
jgi:hypothetical protein